MTQITRILSSVLAYVLLFGCGSVVLGPDAQESDAQGQQDGPLPDAVPPADAAPDSSSDGAPPVYDFAYVSEMTVTSNAVLIDSIALVINRGDGPIKLDDVSVLSVSINHASADFNMLINTVPDDLPRGNAAGRLDATAYALIIDSGLVSSPVTESDLRFGYMLSSPAGDYDMEAEVVVMIGGVPVVLAPIIHRRSSGASSLDSAARTQSL